MSLLFSAVSFQASQKLVHEVVCMCIVFAGYIYIQEQTLYIH